MQKKRIILVFIAIFLVLAGIGGTKKVIEIRQEAQKERQVAFLKAHEKEMTEYIKKNSSDDIKVKYYWDTVERSKSMAFSRPTLSIRFDAVDKKKTKEENYYNEKNTLVMDTDKEMTRINGMWTTGTIIENSYMGK
ncbi:hypothetical protein [uncultured Ligilactobacillus sp.]|uniref:hypothetical protein n=1 Tax=uncultured Ligilactobacillus sp. TaxID=2837633 RepID=UPI00272B8BF9|nr:hypothetical protein [uncultured Ligilactobacillus sp.]